MGVGGTEINVEHTIHVGGGSEGCETGGGKGEEEEEGREDGTYMYIYVYIYNIRQNERAF